MSFIGGWHKSMTIKGDRLKDKSIEPYYTVTEATKILKVCRVTIYNLIKSGAISAQRAGKQYRIPPDELKKDLKLMEGK